jgi:hypothetical protein
MAASVLAHLLLQDALAAALGTKALPVAVEAKLFTALRIGTGLEHRLGRGLATRHGLSLSWSEPDDQRICPARHAENPNRFKPVIIAFRDHSVLVAGRAVGFTAEDRSGLRANPGCGQFVPKGIGANRKGPFRSVALPSRCTAGSGPPLLFADRPLEETIMTRTAPARAAYA